MRTDHPGPGVNAGTQPAGGQRASVAQERRVPVVEAGAWLAPDGDGFGRCPLCFGAMEPAPGMAGFVRHKNARRVAQCVLTTPHYQPDDLAVRRVANQGVSALSRRRFVERWELHYALVKWMWPGVTIQRFMTMLALADVLGLWSYAGLREEDLAVVLLVLAGFIRVRPEAAADAGQGVGASGQAGGADHSRAPAACWVRFWFESSVCDVGDLWMPRESAPELFRVEYREPDDTPFPTGHEVLRCERVTGVHEAWAAQCEHPGPAVDASERQAFLSFAARSQVPGSGESSTRPRRRASKGED